MTAVRASVLMYVGAALLLPLSTYALQPAACWGLYWPVTIGMMAVLSLAAGAAQAFVVLPAPVRLASAAFYALSVQGVMCVPCFSDLDDSARVLRLGALSLCVGWLVAFALSASVVGLAHFGPFKVPRALMAAGLTLAACTISLGATKQYVGLTRSDFRIPLALVDLYLPNVLALAIGAAVLGVGAAFFGRLARA